MSADPVSVPPAAPGEPVSGGPAPRERVGEWLTEAGYMRSGQMMTDEECDRCGQPKNRHNGVELLCPFYSTFRAVASPSRGTPSPSREMAGRDTVISAYIEKIIDELPGYTEEEFRNELGELSWLSYEQGYEHRGTGVDEAVADARAARPSERGTGHAPSEADVDALISETCDRWFQLAPRFQGYDGLQLTLRVFASRVAALRSAAGAALAAPLQEEQP